MLLGIVPNPPTAVSLVAHDTPGVALGPAAPNPLHSPLLHEGGKDRGFMPVARGQDERHELTAAFHPHVALVLKPPWLRPSASASGAFFCSCGMLTGAHNGVIDIVHRPIELPVGVSLLLDRGKEPRPDPVWCPADSL
jgi:hypothetical protein